MRRAARRRYHGARVALLSLGPFSGLVSRERHQGLTGYSRHQRRSPAALPSLTTPLPVGSANLVETPYQSGHPWPALPKVPPGFRPQYFALNVPSENTLPEGCVSVPGVVFSADGSIGRGRMEMAGFLVTYTRQTARKHAIVSLSSTQYKCTMVPCRMSMLSLIQVSK